MSAFASNAQKDFNKSTLSALAKKGVQVVSAQAVPAFEGDVYFSGVAYTLVANGTTSFVRTHSQILVMAKSSWMPNQEGL